MWGDTAVILAQACLPLSIGIAILRWRLFDIDVIINQALVYGSLTTLLGGVYAGLIIDRRFYRRTYDAVKALDALPFYVLPPR